MPHANLFSTLALRPLSPDNAAIPATLSQVKRMLAQAKKDTRMHDAGLDGNTKGVAGLLDRLESWSETQGTSHFLCMVELDPAHLKDIMLSLSQRRTNLRLSLTCSLNGRRSPGDLRPEENGRIGQIQWRVVGPLPEIPFFKAYSKVGIWNHLVLDGVSASPENCNAVANQPNILHSWEASGSSSPACSAANGYGHVRPLPGRPLWQAVNDPADRFMLADCLTRDRLMRLRIDNDGEHLYSVGENLDYHFVAPNRLPTGYLDDICAMVAAGGTVSATHVRSNLERAHLIGYVEQKGILVGNSSLKNPRPEYIDHVRRQSGLDLSGYVERGYTSVRPEYRGLGIGTKLLEGLTRRASDRKIFSVIGEDNAATQIIARRNRTRKVATYTSQKAGKPVGIWMPEWMIETNNNKQRS